ncbi:MAG: HPF/RaiA family ribosome-associated protein [Chthoniobacterales bacterium]
MKLLIKHFAIHPVKALDARVRKHLRKLEPLRQIDEAIVDLACERETSPPYRVRVQLVTPGPDVFAEARDHTLGAALRKVMKRLARIIGDRAEKQRARIKQNLRAPGRLARSSA